jgi:hypothetical protein
VKVPTPTINPVVNQPVDGAQSSAQDPGKIEPGKDIFAEHPHEGIKSEGREPVPPEPAMVVNKEPESAPAKAEVPVEPSTSSSVDTGKSEVEDKSAQDVPPAKVDEAGPLLPEDIEADRVAEGLYEGKK